MSCLLVLRATRSLRTDHDSPVDRVAPMPPAEIAWLALEHEWSPEKLRQELGQALTGAEADGQTVLMHKQ